MIIKIFAIGRPGYDYAAATRRSNLFDGYTGFAIYSSISQGLDEITYGGRRSRRSSITDTSYYSSSRRGSVSATSSGVDYAAILAATAAVEAVNKAHEESRLRQFHCFTDSNIKKWEIPTN